MYSKRFNTKRVNYNGETYILKSPVPICKKCGNEVAIIDDYDLDKDIHNLMSYCPWCNDKHYMSMSHKRFQIYQLPLDEDILYEKIYYQGGGERMRLIDATTYADRLRLIMSCWNCSPCLSPSEAKKATDNLRIALNELSKIPTFEKYKVYRIDSKASYIGYSLVAANTVEEANQYIDSFREEDSNNKCDSWGYSNVSKDDVLEHIFSDKPGIIDYGIRYF